MADRVSEPVEGVDPEQGRQDGNIDITPEINGVEVICCHCVCVCVCVWGGGGGVDMWVGWCLVGVFARGVNIF